MSTEAISLSLYDLSTGEKIKDCQSISLNKANVGEFTEPVAIRMVANGAVKIENIKIAIIDATESISGSGIANSDDSVPSGNAGIEHGKELENKSTLNSFFAGTNTTGLSTGTNTVAIGNMTANSSEYVYLNIQTGSSIGSGFIKYKWFFDQT